MGLLKWFDIYSLLKIKSRNIILWMKGNERYNSIALFLLLLWAEIWLWPTDEVQSEPYTAS